MCFVKHVVVYSFAGKLCWLFLKVRKREMKHHQKVTLWDTKDPVKQPALPCSRAGSYARRSSQLLVIAAHSITSLQPLIACWFKPQSQAFSAGQTEGDIFSPQDCFPRKPRLFHTCWFGISNAVRLVPSIPLKGLLCGHDMALRQTEIILNQICFSLFGCLL